MASSSGGNVTTINKSYLQNLQNQLQDLLDDLNNQPKESTLNSILSQLAPGGVMSNGSSNFGAASSLYSALQTVSSNVSEELSWLQKVLTDMISEIGSTITSFGDADSLNSESVATLTQDFQSTISDIDSPAVSTGSSGSSGSGSGSSGSGGSGSGSSGSGSGS